MMDVSLVRMRIVYVFIASIVLLLLLARCANSHTGATSGEEIFRKNCVSCHGIQGDLKTNGAVDLNYSALSLEERIQVISHGRNLMTPFRNVLTPSQIRSVAEFTMEFNKR